MTKAEAGQSLIGLVVGGRYRITGRAAAVGDAGCRYLANEIVDGHAVGPVELRMYSPRDGDSRDRVVNEARALAGVSHPNIVTFRGAGEFHSQTLPVFLYIATELADDTLRGKLIRCGHLSAAETIIIARHIAEAIRFLSDMTLVHGNLTPSSIVCAGRVWKLADIGIAAKGMVDGMPATPNSLDRSNGVLSRSASRYCSPQLQAGEADPLCDVWALGAVLLECLTGALPCDCSSVADYTALTTGLPIIRDALPYPLGHIIDGCLKLDTQHRSSWETIISQAGSTAPASCGWPPGVGNSIGDYTVNPCDGSQLMWVPSGQFIMGARHTDPCAKPSCMPQRVVYLSGFWIYTRAVSILQFKRFCAATGRTFYLPGNPERWLDSDPMPSVEWHAARAYAEWAGVALPSEAQWEKAARGSDGYLYPWGNEWQEGTADELRLRTSPYGCAGMLGRQLEWCNDWFSQTYYSEAPGSNPPGPETGWVHSVRGGTFGSWTLEHPGCYYRNELPLTYDGVDTTFDCRSCVFRCVYNPAE